eukprot:Platyproteum_vivax@DN1932_c0_g1_i1.p1
MVVIKAKMAGEYYEAMKTKWKAEFPSSIDLEEYNNFYKEFGGKWTVRELVAEFMQHVSLKKKKILDYGCDNGILLNFFNDYGCNLLGVDINSNSIQNGKKLWPHLDLRVTDGTTIPFENDTFDVVIAAAVLKHVRREDRPQLLKEIERVSSYLLLWDDYSDSEKDVRCGDFTFYLNNFSKDLAEKYKVIKEFRDADAFYALYHLKGQ